MNENWKSYHGIALFAIIIITFLAVFWIPAGNILWVWLIMLGALSLFSMVASHGINGRFLLGWLINEQYRMSLSRLQMFLWTIVILSAFFAAVLANVNAEHYENAVNIAIPKEIWIAMGISVTSLIGSPLILSQKKKKKTNNLSNEAITEFPPIDESFIALLAISHAGYLITKAVDKQPDAQQ